LSEIADAITGTVGDMFGDAQTEDAPVAEATEAAVQETEVEATEFPDWEAASRDLFTEDEDDEPDFNALADEELNVADESEDVLAPSEYDTEETAKLKRDALAAQKRAEHYERLHLKTSRKSWEADVRSQPWGQFLPQDLSTVKATSHRDFIKQAKIVAKNNYSVLKPHFESLATERTRLAALAKQEAQVEVQTAWGRPTVGGAQIPATAEQKQGDALTEARKSRSMFKATKAMIENDLI
jgi:hypothetical protein